MKSNTDFISAINYSKRRLSLLALLMLLPMLASAAINVSYGTQNPIVVLGVATTSTFTLTATTDMAAGTVAVALPKGIMYVANSVTNTGPVTVIESNISNLNHPVFELPAMTNGQTVTITFSRTASCETRDYIISLAGVSPNFKDVATVTIGANNYESSPANGYNVTYPSLTYTQPANINNAEINTEYTRTYLVKNSGTESLSKFYMNITYPAGTSFVSMKINGVDVPYTLENGVYKFEISGSFLGPDNVLSVNEEITFTGIVKINSCTNNTTNYTLGWGTSSDPLTWCQTIVGTGSVTMASGSPSLGNVTVAVTNYTDMCTPFKVRFTYRNSSTSSRKVGTMYNIKSRFGTGILPMQGINWDLLNLTTVGVVSSGGTVVPVGSVVNGTNSSSVIAYVDLENQLNQTQAVGTGLTDEDGDGFYDDLAPGASVTIEIDAKINTTYVDGLTCSTLSERWYNQTDMRYTTMCSPTTFVNSNTQSAELFVRLLAVTSSSSSPFIVEGNTPSTAQINFNYTQNTFFRFGNTDPASSYVYELALPAGLTISSVNFTDESGNTVSGVTTNFSGSTYTITSPKRGSFTINYTYTCGVSTSLTIPYKVYRKDANSSSCASILLMYCNELLIPNVICPGSGCSSGPELNYSSVKIARADNSLGWTDNSLATRQSRANISSYDLAKALYLDEIVVSARAVQHGSATNLYQKFDVYKKVAQSANILTPIGMYVTIKRGTETYTTTLPNTAATITGDNTYQSIKWDFTTVLNGSSLFDGDSIITETHYQVASYNLPTHDISTGKSIYFYNLNASNVETFCGIKMTPELYLANFDYVDQNWGNNPSDGCNSFIVGGRTYLVAFRFDREGKNYNNEVRPGALPTKLTFTLPTDYTVSKVTLIGYLPEPGFSEEILNASRVNGTTYTVNLPPKVYPIFTNNLNVTYPYSFGINVYAKPPCVNPNSTLYTSSFEYIPYYYHYAGNESSAPTTTVTNPNISIPYQKLATIDLTNESGNILASKVKENWIVELKNNGTNIAPYTWLAIANNSNVNITRVIEVTNGTSTATEIGQPFTPIGYAGGTRYELSATGISAGAAKYYKIEFTYKSCANDKISVSAGWDCDQFLQNPGENSCGTSNLDLNYSPRPAQVEISGFTQPTSSVNLCENINYTGQFVNTRASYTLDNKLTLQTVRGLSVVSFEAQYPNGTGTWTTITPTVSNNGTVYTYDFNSLSQVLTTNGLAGSVDSPSDNNARTIGFRFSLSASCDFLIGSSFKLLPTAKSPCGQEATEVTLESNAISINGTNASVAHTVSITNMTDVTNCFTVPSFNVKTTITQGTTSANDTIIVTLPKGVSMIANSFTNNTANTSWEATYVKAVVNTFSGETDLYIKMPVGMSEDDMLDFNIGITGVGTVECGANTISVKAITTMQGPACGDMNCDKISIITGISSTTFSVRKPSLNFDSYTLSYNWKTGNYTVNYIISNSGTNDLTDDLTIRYYSTNAEALTTETPVATQTVTDDIVIGGTYSGTFTFSAGSTKNLFAVISQQDNCICAPTQIVFTKNLWMGGTLGRVNDWNESSNWTAGYVPVSGEDVEFATENNYGTAAVADLYVPTSEDKTIGYLVNQSDKATVIPANTGLIVQKAIIGSETQEKVEKIQIRAAENTPNGSLIMNGDNQMGVDVYATVQMYAKGKNGDLTTWTDNIPGSPTYGQTFEASYQWQYFGIPVASMTPIQSFSGAYINVYNESQNASDSYYGKWTPLNNNSPMTAFTGYEITQESPSIYAMAGKLMFCDQSITLTRSAATVGDAGTSGSGDNNQENLRYGLGQNVIANSFTAAIPISNITFATNVESTVYLYNTGSFNEWGGNVPSQYGNPNATVAGSYRAIPKSTSTAVYRNIPSMQGFLLMYKGVSGADGSISQTLPYSNLAKNDNPQTAPASPLSYLEIELSSSSTNDKLWLFSKEGTSNGFDDGWDGTKFFGTPTAFIYTPTQAGNMQVSTTDNIVGSYIDFVANKEKEYTLTLKKVNLDATYPELYLTDLFTGEIRLLNEETTSYSFVADNAGAVARRFRIKNNPYVTESDKQPTDALVVGREIIISNNEVKAGFVRLYDSVGRLIYSHSLEPMSQHLIPIDVSKGVYIANISVGETVNNKKIVIGN